MSFWGEEKKRKPFSMKTKKIEWMMASDKRVYDRYGRLRFSRASKCRVCGRSLKWGERIYDFDHKDNNPANNSQTNCFLVCKVCHGKHTIVKKRRVTGIFGDTVGYETIKKKVGYKKPKKKPKTTKRVAMRNFWGEVIGYRTVKVRKPKTAKEKTATRKKKSSRKKKTKPKATKTQRRHRKKR